MSERVRLSAHLPWGAAIAKRPERRRWRPSGPEESRAARESLLDYAAADAASCVARGLGDEVVRFLVHDQRLAEDRVGPLQRQLGGMNRQRAGAVGLDLHV